MPAPLWSPSAERVATAAITALSAGIRERRGAPVSDYASLHAWSIANIPEFWSEVWDSCGVIGDRGDDPVLSHPQAMPGARFFPRARLNFAENLLRADGPGDALVFRGEDRVDCRLSRDDLREQVAAVAAALRDLGVVQGDRVAGYLPNLPEAVIAMLAATSLGAVWSSCSPDFGPQGVIDRFGQIEPRVLFVADGYFYKGRRHDSLERVACIAPAIPGLEKIVVVPYTEPDPDIASVPGAISWADLLASGHGAELRFEPVGFNDPLYVLFSSGTTGKPKCIVHGVGGTLLKHLCEHRLMCDVRPGDRVFYFTTCGWMMWNWLVSALASGATLLLYDGNPFWPHPEALLRFAERERATLFGTSAKYLAALETAGAAPRLALEHLRTITSTGSPLAPGGFDYVYAHIKADVCLSSIAGGTDIVGCFVGGNPIGPVWRGEIQAPVLGMDIDVFDDDGRSLRGERGELVCKRPFPSMPLGFWNDPDGTRYRAAYFERYPGVWHHGDYIELTEHGGYVIHGRSDATLNPGGVRIGTSEIYRVVEQLPEVEEALVIGQEWGDDVRVVLFVKLAGGHSLDETLVARIRAAVRDSCSPRHVPARVLAVADIPRTRSGKIVELAVRDIVHGRPVKNVEALANPEALELFADCPELRE